MGLDKIFLSENPKAQDGTTNVHNLAPTLLALNRRAGSVSGRSPLTASSYVGRDDLAGRPKFGSASAILGIQEKRPHNQCS